jgi:molybdopterin converting factor small subunit
MKIRVEFAGLPLVSEIVGGKSLWVDFSGRTVNELAEHLAARYGPRLRRFLFDESGALDSSFQVLLNGKEWIPQDGMNRALEDGDVLMLMMLAGGG